MKRAKRLAALALGTLLALLIGAGEARAQAICTPAQTVSAEPDENGRYTTTITCADTAAAEGAADYRHLHYNQAPGTTADPNPADRDTTIANNNPENGVSLRVESGVVFTATGGADMSVLPVDGVIALWRGGAKTVVIEEGAALNFQRTPGAGGSYPAFQDVLLRNTAVYLETEAGPGGDITLRHDGEININYRVHQYTAYQANGVGAISAIVEDAHNDGVRRGGDILLELGATGVIRQLEGSAGMGAVFGVNRSEEGGVTINLAKGSLIDLTAGGGAPAIVGYIDDHPNNAGLQDADIVINAAGTIRNAIVTRSLHTRQGMGLRARHEGTGAIRMTSSGTIETWHVHAVFAQSGWNASHASPVRDDPATEEIEGNFLDVTAGKIHTRAATTIALDGWGEYRAWTLRVAEGATVRAERGEDDSALRALFQTGGRQYVDPGLHSWRLIDTDGDGANDALYPVITAIVIRRVRTVPDGPADRVIVHGTVETEGGLEDVEAAIILEAGGVVEVGPTGRVITDTGLAITAGYAPGQLTGNTPLNHLTVTVAGAVTGDIRARSDGDLTATVSGTVRGDLKTMGAGDLTATVLEGGLVDGDILAMGGGDLTATVSGTVRGDLKTMGAGDLTATVLEGGLVDGDILAMGGGDLTATVSGTVRGDVRATGGGSLTATVLEGGAITGTVYSPTAPMTVHGRVGRILLERGGTVRVSATGRVTGIEGEDAAIRSDAGDLRAEIDGAVEGDVRADGHLTALVSGKVAGGIRSMGAMRAFVSGAVDGEIRADGDLAATVSGKAAGGIYAGGDLSADISGAVTGDVRGMGGLSVVVSGAVEGGIEAPGSGEHSVTVARGGVVTGEVHLAASAVRVDGSIGAARFDADGTLAVGPTGVIKGMSGAAVRAGGALRVDLALNGRRLRDVVGGDITGAAGRTTIIINGMNAGAGENLPNGVWDLALAAPENGTFSTANASERLAPRAGIYESLPGLLLRMEGGRTRRAKTTAAGSPVWARASTAKGWRGPKHSAAGAEYDFDSWGAEAGLDALFPRAPGFTGSLSVRWQRGSADIAMPSGEGEIELTGLGPAADIFWRSPDGWYVNGGFSFMNYEADLSSTRRGALESGLGASVFTLDAEAGHRLKLGKAALTPRVWLSRSKVSVDAFTDSVGARFKMVEGVRATGGGGVVAEVGGAALPRWALGGELSLRGSVDVESLLSLSEEDTVVDVSGVRLRAKAEKTRVLLALGARWRKGPLTIGGEFQASGPGSDDEAYGARLNLGLKF